MNSKVSVIIPAFRAARTINRAIDSLIAQTRRPDEIVVVDDGSPDDLAIAASHATATRIAVGPQDRTVGPRAREILVSKRLLEI